MMDKWVPIAVQDVQVYQILQAAYVLYDRREFIQTH